MSNQSAVSRHPLLAAAAASVTVMLFANSGVQAAWTVEEKTIADLETAYSSGATNPTDVVQQYLNRISTYDDGANGVNAVGQINPYLMQEADAIQGLISRGATTAQ